ncbi:hypothetical protein [Cyclobacterium qasimii]|uniref:Uncharacterized protein n=2 Tax=Cyclobacterium qasimii TaxID=1350429 RepID=S7VD59_9BACT|nr:hypothetical protein [Cyclobacterium qasimii]EPR68165.1 hypothetical protein ADICYQ_2885 [Cyclobacterium qasimii M12-11B]GEO19948.1 hypothetical protein CQA01_04820 [Cyclobacterium qasimii]
MIKMVFVFGIFLSSSVAYGQGLIIRHIPHSIQSNLDVLENLSYSTLKFETSLGHKVPALESNVSDNKLEEDSNVSILDSSKGFSSNIPVKDFSKDFPSRMPMFGKIPVKFGVQLEGIKK